MYPTLEYEKELWKLGYKFIAGIDEVGRGALAGPVVVSAVIFTRTVLANLDARTVLAGVKDSKLLTPLKRKMLGKNIKKHAFDISYGEASVTEINRLGIFKATFMAMRRALQSLQKIEFALIDSFYIPYVSGLPRKKQLAIKYGDKHCFSIAAASILAKVHRDNLMIKLGKKHPQYRMHNHKGYGTLAHRKTILTYGQKYFHRKHFIRKLI